MFMRQERFRTLSYRREGRELPGSPLEEQVRRAIETAERLGPDVTKLLKNPVYRRALAATIRGEVARTGDGAFLSTTDARVAAGALDEGAKIIE